MAYEFAPVPLPAGALEPPRRVPPTAIGLMEAPSGRPRRRRYPDGPSLLRRIALRGLSVIFLLSSVAVLWPVSWQSSVGVGLMSLSVHVAHRSLAPRAVWRYVDGTEASKRSIGGSSTGA